MTFKEFTDLERSKGASNYMYYSGIPTFLRCEYDDPENADVGIVGVPYSGGNWIERTQYLAPRAIRDFSMGLHRSHRGFKISPFELCKIRDLGDVDIPNVLDPTKAVIDIQKFYQVIDASGTIPVSIGGDHSVTLPILHALAGVKSRRHKAPIGLIHLDAHVDAYGPVAGIKEHAGSMFKIALEEGLIDPHRTIQIGIRGAMGDLRQDDWAHDAGYRIIEIDEFNDIGVDSVIAEARRIIGDDDKPTYISWDLDVLDPAYAPAVADPETDGISINEAIKLIRGFRGINIIGADIVCFTPHLDTTRITALNASSILHELVTIIADRISKNNPKK
jgi:guanidinopropionase